MQKLVRLVSKPVSFILLVSFSFNASGQSISAKMEKDFRVDARIKVSQAAQVLNTAVDAYEKSGPKAFADSFGSLLNPEEKTFVIKELKGLPPFPRLKMEGDKLVVFYKKEIIAQLESYDVAQGIFEGGPFHYTFDNNLGLIENLQNWKSLDKGSAQNEQHSRFLMNLFIPQAEAGMTTKAAIPLMICGPLLGGLIGYWLGKPANSPKIAQANGPAALEPSAASTPASHGSTAAAGDAPGKAPSKTGKNSSSRLTTTSANKPVVAAINDCKKDIKCLENLKNKHTSSEDKQTIQKTINELNKNPSTTAAPTAPKGADNSNNPDAVVNSLFAEAFKEWKSRPRQPKTPAPPSDTDTQTPTSQPNADSIQEKQHVLSIAPQAAPEKFSIKLEAPFPNFVNTSLSTSTPTQSQQDEPKKITNVDSTTPREGKKLGKIKSEKASSENVEPAKPLQKDNDNSNVPVETDSSENDPI